MNSGNLFCYQAGMSRDKCGAAAAAGVMATVNMLQPQGVKVVSAVPGSPRWCPRCPDCKCADLAGSER